MEEQQNNQKIGIGLIISRSILLSFSFLLNGCFIILIVSIFTSDNTYLTIGISLAIMALTSLFSISKVGEKWLVKLNGFRLPLPEEKEKINKIMDSIMSKACINKNLNIYVLNDNFPNAMAIGSSTIGVTSAMMEYADEEEMTSILSHEFGHLVHGDSKILAVVFAINTVGRFFSKIFLWLIATISTICGLTADDNESRRSFYIIGIITVSIFNFMVFLLYKILDLGLLAVGRHEEYKADEYAVQIGNGTGLLKFLTKIVNVEIPTKGIAAKLFSTHPNTVKRIEKIRYLMNEN